MFINFVKQQTEIVREQELSPEHVATPRQRSTSLSSDEEPLLLTDSLDTDSDDITIQIERAGVSTAVSPSVRVNGEGFTNTSLACMPKASGLQMVTRHL